MDKSWMGTNRTNKSYVDGVAAFIDYADDLVKFQYLLLDAEKPLYEGCPDFYQSCRIVKTTLLEGDDKDLTACRTCGISRWKVDNKTHKVYENIQLKEKNVAAKSLSNLLHVREKTKDRVRWLDLDLAELGGSIPVEAESLSDLQESVSKYVRRIYMDPRATVVTDISKEVATTRQAFYYEVLQEIWVLDYRFRKIPLFKCDWVNHRVGGVKRDNLGLHIAFAELAFAHYHCTLHCTCLCKQRHLHILHL
ncbi:hypothetical protein Tco_0520340 [Tanacetum coccineum]